MSNFKKTVLPLMLLGDSKVGKTSLILKLTKNTFDDLTLSTLGKESFIYQVNLHGNDLKMKIWDTAGQERFKSMSLNVIKSVDGLILVYSITSKSSFNNLEYWLNQLKDICDLSKKAMIIIGNKSDLQTSREVTYEEGEQFAKSRGCNFYETSAATGENIQEVFNDIFEQLYILFEDEIKGIKKDEKTKITITKHNKNILKKCC